MLIGMALAKLGVFAATARPALYRGFILAGLLIGLPLAILSTARQIRHNFDVVELLSVDWHLQYVASFLMALGYVGVVMLVCRAQLARGFRRVTAAVGRMALSNYLFQTLVCTTIFYGHGLGLFERVSRSQLMLIVVGVWILQVIFSLLWLRRFQIGPAEWLWRTLTYGKRPGLRRPPGYAQASPTIPSDSRPE